VQPLNAFRDPAHSRLAYRVNRWMLTPLFRRFLFVGLPAALLVGATAGYFSDTARREAITAGFAEIRRSIEQRPEFMVKIMAIDGAAEDTAALIREVVPVTFPISSFELDLAMVRAQVQSLDAIARVDVRVRAGGVLQIDVEERLPALVWRSATGLELLDPEGRRVGTLAARTDRTDLPLIAGSSADAAVPEALRLFAAAEPVKDRLRGLLRVGERRWDVVLDRDQRILLPPVGAVEALEQVLALDGARELLARNVTVVDMRLPHRPTLRLDPHAVEELRRVRSPALGAN
jgi:cell division protein FtsQ